jgi:hypothetical protein
MEYNMLRGTYKPFDLVIGKGELFISHGAVGSVNTLVSFLIVEGGVTLRVKGERELCGGLVL